MNFFSSDAGIRTHVLAIEPGEYMMESITALIERKGIRNAAVVSGIGTLDHCIMHMVKPGKQGEQVIREWHDTPLEVVAMQGVIADGKPHIHFSISTDQAGVSGHPHDGCRILHLREVVIIEFLGLNLTRLPGAAGIDVLCEKAA
jgi:predicted DNA-binding protein with PD1-like motif